MSQLNPGNPKFPGKQLTYADLSDAVADLLERGWTQGHFAVGEHDNVVYYRSEYATKFCALGAISYISDDNKISLWHKSLWVKEFLGYLSTSPHFTEIMSSQAKLEREFQLAGWNDNHLQTQANLVGAFRDFAIYMRSLD